MEGTPDKSFHGKTTIITLQDIDWIFDLQYIDSWSQKDIQYIRQLATNPSEQNTAAILSRLPRLIDRAAGNDWWNTYDGLTYSEDEAGTREYSWQDPWREYTFTLTKDGLKSEPTFRYLHPPGPILKELWRPQGLDKCSFQERYEAAGFFPLAE